MNRTLSYAWFLLPIAAIMGFTWLVRNLQLDDALIYLRYIRNFHDGFGLVFNPDARFNALTSPLYTLIMLVITTVVTSYQAVMIGVSALCLAVAALLGGQLFSQSRAEAVFTSTVIACCGYFYLIFGMEAMLFLMLIGISLYCYKKESPYFVIALALLVCTRSEGIFLAGPMAIDYLWRYRRLPDWRFAGVGLLIFITPFIFNLFYFGEVMSPTGSAKISQGQSGLWGEDWIFLIAPYQFYAVFGESYLVFLFFLSFSCYGLYVQIRDRVAVLAVVFGALLLLFYLALNIPSYPWYYAPFFYLMLIFTSRGLWHAGSIILGWHSLRRYLAMATLLLVAGFSLSRILSFAAPGPNGNYIEASNWLQANTAKDATIAMVEIGTVGWYSQRPIFDILGLVTENNADYLGRREFYRWIGDYQPDYLLRHEPVWGHEISIALLEAELAYIPVTEFQVPGLVLLRRSSDFTPRAAQALIQDSERITRRHEELTRMIYTFPPLMKGAEGHLFSHAPSSLSLPVTNPIASLAIGYGVEQTAQGLHHGICFEVIRESDEAVLMADCISADAGAEELARRQTVNAAIEAGDRLIFNNTCQGPCDYGWSYWDGIQLHTAQ